MASEGLTPVRTDEAYTIQVLGPQGWVPAYSYGEDHLDDALADMDVMFAVTGGDKAHRLIEWADTANIIQELWPDGEVYGPVKEPWLEEGF